MQEGSVDEEVSKEEGNSERRRGKNEGGAKNATGAKTAGTFENQVAGRNQRVDTVAFVLEGLRARSGEQSGDLQGLSNVQSADSESVDELLEQGNAFEAEVATGVEDAEDADEREVCTHEVPEHDASGELWIKSGDRLYRAGAKRFGWY